MTAALRKVIFWAHLVMGVGAGGVILILCLTGAALAFEKEILAWVDRDVSRSVSVVAEGNRLGVAAQWNRFRTEHPDLRPATVTLHSDPGAALEIGVDRSRVFYVDAGSGAVRPTEATGFRRFFQTMIEWHRWLGRADAARPWGKAVTGFANAAFVVLVVSGVVLWWPRTWRWVALRSVVVPRVSLRGRARDWNWHLALGIWSAPVLLVLTLTALPISYAWPGNLLLRAFGDPVPPARTEPRPTPDKGGPPAAAREEAMTEQGDLGDSLDATFVSVQAAVPRWRQIAIRLESGRREGGGRGADSGAAASPFQVTVREHGAWPLFASRQLTVDRQNGRILKEDGYARQSAGRQARGWTRFLHTGEALGLWGKAAAGLGSMVGAVLVWTGLALAWRRWRGRRGRSSETEGS